MNQISSDLQALMNEFSNEQPGYCSYKNFLESVLQRACMRFDPLAIVQARVKKARSFAEKCVRKKYEEPFKRMTDLCGARVIVRSKHTVPLVGRFIRDNFLVDEANSADMAGRLGAAEFGYGSLHLVVQVPEDIESPSQAKIRRNGLPLTGQERQWLKELNQGHPRKAEIQVRTLLQHVWADVVHDRIYKTKLRIPPRYARVASRLAALLEEADNSLGSLSESIDAYQVDYGAHMTKNQLADEFSTLQLLARMAESNFNSTPTPSRAEVDSGPRVPSIQEVDSAEIATLQDRGELALRLAKVAKSAGDWDSVIEVSEPFLARAEILERDELRLEHGYALCKRHEEHPLGPEFKRGCDELRKVKDEPALERTELKARALAALAWSERKRAQPASLREARNLNREAHACSPGNPYILKEFLECELRLTQRVESIDLLGPEIVRAVEKCAEHAEVGIELPYAHFTSGKLNVLAKRTQEGMLAYVRGIASSSTSYALEEELASVEALEDSLGSDLRQLEQVRLLLLLGIAAKEHVGLKSRINVREKLEATFDCVFDRVTRLRGSELLPSLTPLTPPIIAVVGGAAARFEIEIEPYREMLRHACFQFKGTVFSGGTMQGIPGHVGEIAKDAAQGGKLQAFAYIPRLLPEDATPHDGYRVFVIEGTEGFTYREPMQSWAHVLLSGASPKDVRILGIGGGPIAKFEFHLGLALGATVGILANSGRASEELLKEEPWWPAGAVLALPNDRNVVRAFLHSGELPSLNTSPVSTAYLPAAKKVHDFFVQDSQAQQEPASWESLSPDFQLSNIHQAIYAEKILRGCGFTVHKRVADSSPVLSFETNEIERMAAMEHGRWVFERLRQGWRYGAVRDNTKKVHPLLVGWEQLPLVEQEKDRNAVRRFPEVLREAGFEISRV